ncbi:MAG: hypothetical protein CMH77_07035 [Nitrospinae bacterium]|jgi:anti-anti-sigma factor|nr:hypothetical protein [Nitrospinota bacterium]|tara:strand:- start:5201 stop:5497 length:297 start_codon:yes stop_codon:yes gene_type:complete
MDFELTDEQIYLGGIVDFSELDTLHEIFKQILARDDSSLVVDVSGIKQIDTAALQLFLAFSRDARASGKRVDWRNIPASLSRPLKLTGFDAILNRPDS